MRLLDLFCGRWGWGREFARRGHTVFGVDLIMPTETPEGCEFILWDVLKMWATPGWIHFDNEFACVRSEPIDAIVASSPCEEFSVHGMACFHKNPPYPEMGIKLFNHTRALCEVSGLPYVMENVRPAQQFVGPAAGHCGPFYMWGTGVPSLVPQGLIKGVNLRGGLHYKLRTGKITRWQFEEAQREVFKEWGSYGSKKREQMTAKVATIPPELANCVADYAEALLRDKVTA